MQQCLKMTKWFAVVGSCAGLGLFKPRKESYKLTLPCRWPHILPHLVVENNQSRSVPLVSDRQIKDRCSDEARVVHLRRCSGGILHRIAGIEQPRHLATRLAA